MGVLDGLKSRFGFGDGWQDEYLQEGLTDASTTTAGQDASSQGSADPPALDGSLSAALSAATAPEDGATATVAALQASDSGAASVSSGSSERYYSYESPYASGAAPRAVTKHARKPDLQRASAASGSTLREVATATPNLHPQSDDGVFRVRPTGFSEARAIADRFKSGMPVGLDLSLVESLQRQRFIDFAAGLVYALDGTLSRTANHSYLLTPRVLSSKLSPKPAIQTADKRASRSAGRETQGLSGH
jgi:FtsZ-interacting cell division protein YlmF